MTNRFQTFISQLKETHLSLCDYVDFAKVEANVDSIAIKLHQLNYLIGQENMAEAVKRLWNENSTVFSVLDILIAIRTNDKKKAIDAFGNIRFISDYFKTPSDVIEFLNSTGLTQVFQTKQIKNLVDYVFGIEVGLDSNARKNRGGHIMENLVANIFSNNGIEYRQEVYCSEFPAIKAALGVDTKRFDFVIETPVKTYLIETNFYTGGGSKLNEVARAYTELAPKINSIPGYEFIWITDGVGWKSALSKLQEAFDHIPGIYNLSSIQDFISRIEQ